MNHYFIPKVHSGLKIFKMTGVPVPRQKEGHRGNCDDDSDSDDEHTQPSFILKHCEELGINELKK